MKNIDKRRLTISLLTSFFLIYIFVLVFLNETNFLDLIYIKRTETMLKIFKLITKLGNWYTLIIITLGFLVFDGKKSFKYISINLATAALLNQGLKFLFQRPRPELNIIAAMGYSFPSGHSMVSMAFYGFLIYMLLKTNHSNKYKTIGSILLFMIILMIGFSRIYLGAHYVTDVLAGFALGIIYLVVFTFIIKKGGNNSEKN